MKYKKGKIKFKGLNGGGYINHSYYTDFQGIPERFIKHGNLTLHEDNDVEIVDIYQQYYIVKFKDNRGNYTQLGFKEDALEYASNQYNFCIEYTDAFTEEIFDALKNWCKSVLNPIVWYTYVPNTYANLKIEKYFWVNARIDGNDYTCGVDNNAQGYPIISLEELCKIIGYKKEDSNDFILPNKWLVKVTLENSDILTKWKKEVSNDRWSDPATNYDYVTEIGAGENYRGKRSFITFEQFKKYVLKRDDIPRYVELLKGWSVGGEYVGEIFDTSIDFQIQFKKFKSVSPTITWEKLFSGYNKRYFKPSTKAAYDQQLNKNPTIDLEEGNVYSIVETSTGTKWLVKISSIKGNAINGPSIAFNSSPNFYKQNSWGTISDVHSSKLATDEEKQHLEACISAGRYVSLEDSKKENPPFKKGDYLVLLDTPHGGYEIGDVLRVEGTYNEESFKAFKKGTKIFSKGFCNDVRFFRKASIDEIKKHILEIAKKKYPEGTIHEGASSWGSGSGNRKFTIKGNLCWGGNNLYSNGASGAIYSLDKNKWSNIITEVNKSNVELKEEDYERLLKEANQRYELGTKILTSVAEKELILDTYSFPFRVNRSHNMIYTNDGFSIYSIKHNEWAKIVSEPIKTPKSDWIFTYPEMECTITPIEGLIENPIVDVPIKV